MRVCTNLKSSCFGGHTFGAKKRITTTTTNTNTTTHWPLLLASSVSVSVSAQVPLLSLGRRQSIRSIIWGPNARLIVSAALGLVASKKGRGSICGERGGKIGLLLYSFARPRLSVPQQRLRLRLQHNTIPVTILLRLCSFH